MERSTEQSAKRKLTWVAGIAAFFAGLLIWGTASGQVGASLTPELALDLQGGTQIILTPTIADGSEVSLEQLNQAATIIRQRVDGSGVAEATVTVQGEQNIVVAIPGTPSETTLQLIKAAGCQAGLTFNPAMPLDVLEWVLDKVDLVLLMSVNPGFGGQSFIDSALRKCEKVRRLIEASGRDIRLEVDGGIKVDNIRRVADAGADTFVAGSAIFGQPDYKAVIQAMRAQLA